MNKFVFNGKMEASKSLFNRALIVKSYEPKLKIIGESHCDDVLHLQKIVEQLSNTKEFECGEAGTILRFLALRLSRQPGVYVLKGSERLFSRPNDDLMFVLDQLGVTAAMQGNSLVIESQGWKKPLIPVKVHREKSSQFSSGLLLNCWDLPFELEFELVGNAVSDAYFKMTMDFVQAMGLSVQSSAQRWKVKPGQKVTATEVSIEPDYSSMFAVSAVAAICGAAQFNNLTANSLQPDFQFISFLKQMGVPMKLVGTTLSVARAEELQPANFILRDSPDLFPSLAVLCAFANGESKLIGAPQLVYKESDRLKRTKDLLAAMGVQSEVKEQGLVIQGVGRKPTVRHFEFDADQDHRMAMAAGILVREGWPVKLIGHKCVKKSFPGFWKAIGLEK